MYAIQSVVDIMKQTLSLLIILLTAACSPSTDKSHSLSAHFPAIKHNMNDSTWYNRKIGSARYMLEVKYGDPRVAIAKARALFRCGDHFGLGRQILAKYANDLHGHYFRHAAGVMGLME